MKYLNLVALLLFLLSCLGIQTGDSASRSIPRAPTGLNPGPDIITGDISDLEQYGSNGTQVGLGVSTTSCNAGMVPVDFFALPNTDHPVIPHNMYRMSGGSNNEDRFEQIGHSWVKHAFGADQFDDCNLGCIPEDFTHLGVGCSDTYLSFQNAIQDDLGSRALVNPFTGVFKSTANNHVGHDHTGTSHRVLVETSDLDPALNPGATYFCEVQYISPVEYAWCQTHPGECNMYNNSSYRRFLVNGTTSFSFKEFGSTHQMMPAVRAWTGATINPIEPEPGVDGRAFVAYKVTGPVAGVWHYEYALYNENLDRGIQAFSVPLGCGMTVSNPGFHAPPNHPGFPNDGTQGGTGFSNAAWTLNQTNNATWNTETLAQNQNANAIRWGTLYNFRFDSSHAPIAASATIGFFKTGAPVTVGILGPDACDVFPTPTPGPTGTPSSPTPTATPTLTPAPSLTPTPTATPTPSQAVNLSTRLRVDAGEGVGIGGFIITGTGTQEILLRGLGPSLASSGIPNPVADPVIELHGPSGFTTIINDNCMFAPLVPCPPDPNESQIRSFLNPGSYTVILRGNGNPVGVALIEIYDVEGFNFSSKLANISTRGLVGTDSEVMIAGFIVGNPHGGPSGDDRIVVRGIGPSLASVGLSNTLANPALELHNSDGAIIRANDNWQDDPAQVAELTKAGLALSNSQESGIIAVLTPGAYTAILFGADSQTGLGLVEVYDLGPP